MSLAKITSREEARALRDTEEFYANGVPVVLVARDGSSIDSLTGSVEYGPNSRSVMNRAGWKEELAVAVFISTVALEKAGLTIHHIERYEFVEVGKKRYRIEKVGEADQFGSKFLTVCIGGQD